MNAEARLITLEAEADELLGLVVRLEVERADLSRQLEISERAPAGEEPEAKAEGELARPQQPKSPGSKPKVR